ncbi:MAG: protein TolR [Acetobacteraceae bacterium]|nr:protein TolR [Acetobacteraceae bacterium]
MAFSLNGKTKTRGRYRPLSEINVTPLVDVMLVLLIIFMVTAPLMTSGVPVDLPKTSAQPLNSDSEPLTVSVNAEGKIYLQDQEVPLGDLVAKLQAIARNNPDRRIFVRGDKELAYGRIMEVMGTITQGGFTKVALLAEQPAPTPGHAPAPAQTPAPTPGSSSSAPAPAAPSPAPPASSSSAPRQGHG